MIFLYSFLTLLQSLKSSSRWLCGKVRVEDAQASTVLRAELKLFAGFKVVDNDTFCFQEIITINTLNIYIIYIKLYVNPPGGTTQSSKMLCQKKCLCSRFVGIPLLQLEWLAGDYKNLNQV